MTNSQEETVNLDIYKLFVGLTLAFYQMSAFYAILTKETKGIVLEQDFDVLTFHDSLLHHLWGT